MENTLYDRTSINHDCHSCQYWSKTPIFNKFVIDIAYRYERIIIIVNLFLTSQRSRNEGCSYLIRAHRHILCSLFSPCPQDQKQLLFCCIEEKENNYIEMAFWYQITSNDLISKDDGVLLADYMVRFGYNRIRALSSMEEFYAIFQNPLLESLGLTVSSTMEEFSVDRSKMPRPTLSLVKGRR